MPKQSREQSLSLAKWIRERHPLTVGAEEAGATVEELASQLGLGSVPEDECVEWGAGFGGNGYGVVNVKSKAGRWTVVNPHRALLVIIEGESELEALHSCGNKKCINLCHIRYGTQLENVEDQFRLGETSNFGEGCHLSKLTAGQVKDIRSRYRRGTGRTDRGNGFELRAQYGISSATLSRVVNGVSWVR